MRRRVSSAALHLMAGWVLGLVVFAMGLIAEARHPALPGTTPGTPIYSGLFEFGAGLGPGRRLRLGEAEHIQAADPQGQWHVTHSRRVVVEHRGQQAQFAADFVGGDLLRALNVPVRGAGFSQAAVQLPLSAAAVREVVLSEALAFRLFGSADAALGQTLDLQTLRARFMEGGDRVSYRIVGVVLGPFAGADLERPAQLWIGINGWFGVLFPEQQLADVRTSFSAHTVSFTSEDPDSSARIAGAALQAEGLTEATVAWVPGLGFQPERRNRFLALARALSINLTALGAILLLSLVGFAWVQRQRQRGSDLIRCALGEDSAHRWRRQLLAAIPRAAWFLLGLCSLLLFGPYLLDGLPIREAIRRALHEPTGLALLMLSLLTVLSLPYLLSLQGRRTRIAAHGWSAAAVTPLLFGLLLAVGAIGYTSGLSELRLQAALEPPLPATAREAGLIEVQAADGSMNWMMDRTATRGAEVELAKVGVALATLPPLGGRALTWEAEIEGRTSTRGTIQVNHVTANFFDVLGIAIEQACPSEAIANGTAAWVNRSFLRVFAPDLGAATLRVRYADLFERADLTVCGIVADAYLNNARGSPAPVLYRPLQQRRSFEFALAADAFSAEQRGRLEGVLAEFFRNTRASLSEDVRARIRFDLAHELALARLNGGLSLAAGVLAAIAAVQLGQVALRLRLQMLATRRALGARRRHLLHVLLLPRSAVVWVTLAAVLLCLLMLVQGSLHAPMVQRLQALMIALAAISSVLAWLVYRLLAELREERLHLALRAEG